MRSLERPICLAEETGDGGRKFEDIVRNHILPEYKPSANFEAPPRRGMPPKADAVENKGGIPENNSHFSIKLKRNNNAPFKAHQTEDKKPLGLFSKFNTGSVGQSQGDYAEDIRNDKVKQALIMKFGSHQGNLNEFRNIFAGDNELNERQIELLRKFDSKNGDEDRKSTNQFLTTGEMREHFPEHLKALKDHLNNADNKREIFDKMIRKNGFHKREAPWSKGDVNPVDKLVHHVKESDRNMSGNVSIRDISNNRVKSVMEKLQWFFPDEGNFYLNDIEEEDFNKRLLDIYPINKESSNWAVLPGGDDADEPRRRRRIVNNRVVDAEPPTRGKGIIEPGHFKATMGADEKMLDRFFPKEWERHMTDRGSEVPPTFERIPEEDEDEDSGYYESPEERRRREEQDRRYEDQESMEHQEYRSRLDAEEDLARGGMDAYDSA